MGHSIVVFGSFVVDLTSRQHGFPKPGETLLGTSFKMGAGGKGSNQAVAAHRAGADVALVTKLGMDVFADVALDFYREEGMVTDFILRDDRKETGIALILVDESSAQNEIVVVPGACGNITQEDVNRCHDLICGAELFLVQLEINFEALYNVIDLAHEAGVRVVLNPAPANKIREDIYHKIDYITPNETEAQVLTGIEICSEEDVTRAAAVFHHKGVRNVVITLGEKGAFASDGTKSEFIPRIPVKAIDTTGAGDAFNGGFVMALAQGMTLFDALRYGNVTGALSVTRLGTAPSMPRKTEIDTLYYEQYFQERK